MRLGFLWFLRLQSLLTLCFSYRILLRLAAGDKVEDSIVAKILEHLATIPVHVHLLDVLSGEEGSGVGTLGAQRHSETSQLAQLDLLALEQQLAHAVHHLDQHTLDDVAAVERSMLSDVLGEVVNCQIFGNLSHPISLGLGDVLRLGSRLCTTNHNTVVNHTF